MGARVMAVVLAVALVGGGALLYREHARASALASELAVAKRAREICEHDAKEAKTLAFAGLANAFSAATSARQHAHADKADSLATEEHAPHDAGSGKFEDMPGDQQAKVFDAIDKVKQETEKKLGDLKQKLHLDADQDKLLGDQIEAMNKAIVANADRLLTTLSQTKDPPPRPLIDALADGLDAIRGADDAFRASLDDEQKKAFDADGFDLSSQIDPMPLFTRALALASSRSDVGVSANADDKP